MRKKFIYFLLAVIFLLASFTALQPYMFKIHDFTHGARIAEMSRALLDGHFPVRWVENFGFGFGMPLFEFYGPLPFYLASVIYIFTQDLIFSVKFLFLICNLLTVIGSYLIGKKLFKNEWSGVITSAALSLAPYRALNLYVRGAVNETWGIMAVPWILWAVVKVIKKEKYGWLWLSSSLTVLFLSHNLAAFIFAPFIFGFALVYLILEKIKNKWSRQEFILRTRDLTLSALLGIGLSAFYIIPAFFEKELTQVSQVILGDYFDYNIHFVYIRQFFNPNWGFGGSEWGANDAISFFLGWGQFLILGLGAVFMTRLLLRSYKKRLIKIILPLFLALALGAALLMSTHKSLFVWRSFSLLEYLQFPWRFLGAAAVFLALFAGWTAQQIGRLKLSINLKFCLLMVVFTGMLVNAVYFRSEEMLSNPKEYYFADEARIRTETSEILPDYIPVGMPDQIDPAFSLVLNENELAEKDLKVRTNRVHRKVVKTNFSQPQLLELSIADYPHWLASIDGQKPVKPETVNGHLAVKMPQGEHLLSIKLYPTTLRLVSDLISLASLMILLTFSLYKIKISSKHD